MNTPRYQPAPFDRTDLSEDLSTRDWSWLIDLGTRLNVGLQLVDLENATRLPDGEGANGVALTRALASKSPPVRAALDQAIRTHKPHVAAVDTLLMYSFPLAVGHSVVGALVVAREVLGGAAEAERAKGELELVGSTLSSAASAHLASGRGVVADGGDLERIGALARLLSELPSDLTDREIVASYAEALAVWHDIELRGFIQTSGGAYELDVAPPGMRSTTGATQLPASASPEDAALVPLSHPDEDRLGLTALGQTFVAKVASGPGSWLLLFSGRIDAHAQTRLMVYTQLVRDRLAARAGASTARLTTAMARSLLGGKDRADVAASQALQLLEEELGAAAAMLSVTLPTGTPVVRAGRTGSGTHVDGGEFVVTRRAPQQPSVTVAVGREDGRPLTRFQRELIESAADLFEAWARGAAVSGRPERRARARGMDEVMDQFAAQASERGMITSALVFSSPRFVFRPGLANALVAQARAMMRASDIVGVLDETEVGFLLFDAAGPGAHRAADRLRRVLARHDAALQETLAVGVATCTPGLLKSEGLVHEARTNAQSSPPPAVHETPERPA